MDRSQILVRTRLISPAHGDKKQEECPRTGVASVLRFASPAHPDQWDVPCLKDLKARSVILGHQRYREAAIAGAMTLL